jgi:F-type H+-transporting ATPase subunit delta
MVDPERLQDTFDIDLQRLGAIYAEAMLGATARTGDAVEVLAELDSLIDEVLVPHPDLDLVLRSPRISIDEKNALLDRVFGGRFSPQLLIFLKVVNRHRRLECLREIRDAAHKQLNRAIGRVEIELTTAAPVDRATENMIADVMRGVLQSDVVIQVKVDPQLLGGLSIRVGDKVFDGSVAGRLERLRDEMIQKATQTFREGLARFAQ